MSRAASLLALLMAIGCVSTRERSQSVHAASESSALRLRDSAWLERLIGSLTVEFSETEGWTGSSFPPGGYSLAHAADSLPPGRLATPADGNTVPTAGSYFRTRRLSLRADSSSLRTGRLTDTAATHTAATESSTVAAGRKTAWPIGRIGILVGVVALAVVAFRLARKVFR